MVELLEIPIPQKHISIYDPACGTGGMLSVAKEHLFDRAQTESDKANVEKYVTVHGQELQPANYAICKADMLIKNDSHAEVFFGNSLIPHEPQGREPGDQLSQSKHKFDFMLSNPPFGVTWGGKEGYEKEARKLQKTRYKAGMPRTNDGAFLFQQTMLAKMKRRQTGTLDDLRKANLHSVFAPLIDVTERIKDISKKIGSGVTPEGGSAGYLDSGVPLLRSQNVHFDGLRLDDVAFISPETHASMANSQLKPRDVLLNITGASIGRCTFVPEGFGEGNVNQHVCIIRPGHKIEPKFLVAFLSSPFGQAQIMSTFTGASRQGLSHKELGLIRIPLPSLPVQRETLRKIELQEIKRRELSLSLQKQIETLVAYRKSLIHECVTGKRRITDADLKQVGAHV